MRQQEREERAIERETEFAKLVSHAATTNSPIIRRPVVPAGAYYKLGQEGEYKKYVNQYTVQQSALSKAQTKDEQEKKTRLSHKFSLTDVSVDTIVVLVSPVVLKGEQKKPSFFKYRAVHKVLKKGLKHWKIRKIRPLSL